MKISFFASILYSSILTCCTFLYAEAAEAIVDYPIRVLDSAAFNDIEIYRKKCGQAPLTRDQSPFNTAPPSRAELISFAEKSMADARRALFHDAGGTLTIGRGHFVYLASLAHIPCDIKNAKKAIQKYYDENNIPEGNRKHFDLADKHDNWNWNHTQTFPIKTTQNKTRCCIQ